MNPSQPNNATGSWRTIFLIVLAITAARIIYLYLFCPYKLIEDEAHYWEWSRRLSLSYYSKGPGIAWLIALSTSFLGDTAPAIRFFAPISGAITTLATAWLAHIAFNSTRAAFYAAACILLAPIFQFTNIIMAIDSPYVACWALASCGCALALIKGNPRGWLLLGAAVALGFLVKYTILLILPGVLLAAFVLRIDQSRSSSLSHARHTKHILLGTAIASLGLLPVIIWNAQHDWATVHHLLGHLQLAGGDLGPELHPPYNITWTLELIAIQLGAIGPAMLLAIYAWRSIRTQHRDLARGARLCIALATPVLVFYFIVTFFTRAEGNWPMAGWISILALAGAGAATGLDAAQQRLANNEPRTILSHRRTTWHITLIFGIITALATLRLDLIAKIPILGNIIPIGRLTSAEPIAISAQAQLDTLAAETNLEPFLISQHYGRASLMAFYLKDQPTTYCASSINNGRQTQYDLWPQTNLADPTLTKALLGRPALLMGGSQQQWSRAFNTVLQIDPLQGDHKQRPAFLAYQYKGFPTTSNK